ncbi:MAG TPA: pilin [Candidatus Pacearchaeota archaeon]|nr:pilin [Candidatus Pacearchaeota archaeon]
MPLLKTKKIFLLFTLLFLAVSPVLGDGLVPCDGWDCTSDNLIGMIGSIFDLIAFQIVPALAVIGFVIAGIIMITSGGDPAKFNRGKSAMIAIVVGLIIVYLAWAIVKLFIETIGGEDWTMEFFKEDELPR